MNDHIVLLGEDEPDPFEILRPSSDAPFFLTCDHGGRRIPASLGNLGLAADQLTRHIAWDIGAGAIARRLSERLNATLVLQPYSRLVVDCNRTPEAGDFIAPESEGVRVPGNEGLSAADRAARIASIYRPYHAKIEQALDRRAAHRLRTVLVAIHTCTDVYHGVWRPWHVGVLYDRDDRFAQVILQLLRAEGELTVGENEPYDLTHLRDYSVPVHAEVRRLHHVEFEVRQDLVADESGQAAWAQRLGHTLEQGLVRLDNM